MVKYPERNRTSRYFTLKLFRKEKRAIEEFEKRTGGEGGKAKGVGTLTSWINLKRETEKNNQVSFVLFQTLVDAGRKTADKLYKRIGRGRESKGSGYSQRLDQFQEGDREEQPGKLRLFSSYSRCLQHGKLHRNIQNKSAVNLKGEIN